MTARYSGGLPQNSTLDIPDLTSAATTRRGGADLLLGVNYTYVESRDTMSAGDHQVRMEFTYEGEGLGKGGGDFGARR